MLSRPKNNIVSCYKIDRVIEVWKLNLEKKKPFLENGKNQILYRKLTFFYTDGSYKKPDGITVLAASA